MPRAGGAVWNARRDARRLVRRDDQRDEFERDLSRVIHTAGFRRLQTKTQVIGISEGDFHRTRLTHSLEVAQIGGGLVKVIGRRGNVPRTLLPSTSLISTVCLAHDIGHPPFGHSGEVALNYCMRQQGGFEGNGQTLRLLSLLEAHSPGHGLNLCRRTLLGVLKYPVVYDRVVRMDNPPAVPHGTPLSLSYWKPPKCYLATEAGVVDWILEPLPAEDKKRFISLDERPPTMQEHGKPTHKSFDASIMEIADDIAYGIHDLEDAIALDLVSREQVVEHVDPVVRSLNKKWLDRMGLRGMMDSLFSEEHSDRKRMVGALVNAMVTSVDTRQDNHFRTPLLKHRAVLEGDAKELLAALDTVTKREIIESPESNMTEYRGQMMIRAIFEGIASAPWKLLPGKFREDWRRAGGDTVRRMRIICDYISGMTDEYATKVYERMHVPRHVSFFQRL